MSARRPAHVAALTLIGLLIWSSNAFAGASRWDFSDAELIDGFMRTVFGTEALSPGAPDDRVRKYTDPVQVRIENHARADRTADIRTFVRTVNRSIGNLQIKPTRSKRTANMVIHLVDRANYRPVIRRSITHFDTAFLERNACSAIVGAEGSALIHAEIFIVVDDSPAAFQHCMIEEILQSLGAVNDDRRLTYSIFNDYSRINKYAAFDWFILNMLYDRRVRVGMTPRQARQVLPAVIADARRRLPHARRIIGF